MHDLLYLAHRIPYPPNKGDKIRSWNILRDLAAHYRVHLGCFVDDPTDREHQPMLEKLCASCHFASLNPSLAKLRGLVGLLSGAPITLGYYRDAGLARDLRDGRRVEAARIEQAQGGIENTLPLVSGLASGFFRRGQIKLRIE